MNNRQRKAVSLALIIIGLMLLYTMVVVDTNARSPVFNTAIFSGETQAGYLEQNLRGQTYMPTIKTYVYISHGIVGILLGLITPLVL